jgi:hypothetical protein
LILPGGGTGTPDPPVDPIPPTIPTPPEPLFCTDELATYHVGERIQKRTTRSKEEAFKADMGTRGWQVEGTNKVQKNNVDVTFRCVGKAQP